jgi:nucleoside-diphosphate kinase
MSSGPAVVMVLAGEDVIARYRKLMGATNYKEAEEGTIRRDFATDIEKNVVHGSDSPESAAFEIGYFFNGLEIAGQID